ncbi:expressed unknown protein [Ectocarpus siliculosus]|uniref:Uncharacterized protein n=1 Tax=Ectocarpus siliculosus TaxID=2880 RepID=D8LHQ3_ECTSI|nr:expressed unknown protein [Ectocarpus siliculosus]|eukprot:CBN79335.1 expressed unknown protein [Ectocarpus siliculosus]
MPSSPTLPPLVETFPEDKYPLREVGQGFTAQACQGEAAQACAAIAAEMLDESRTVQVSHTSVNSDSLDASGMEAFPVDDLPLPDGAVETGLLILRNERILPGMVGISLPLKGNLWVREDGTCNLSGFFRRQIPKFELGLLMAAKEDMSKFLDCYHAVYRPVVEHAAQRQQFQVIRTLLETGLGYYKDDSPTRRDLLELRARVTKLRSRSSASSKDAAAAAAAAVAAGASSPTSGGNMSTEEVMETRRRISDSKLEKDGAGAGAGEGTRSTSFASGGESDDASRSGRVGSGPDRKLKIAQQVVGGDAPKQSGPFRLWKSKTGEASYSKEEPS